MTMSAWSSGFMTDPRQMRIEYERSVRSLFDTAARMKLLGVDPENDRENGAR
jgi:hypothetical protein